MLRRTTLLLSPSLLAVLAFLSSVPACSSGGSQVTILPPIGERVDQPSTAALSVDEGGIRGQIAGTELRLQVPVSASAGDANGELTVRLLSVDGKRELALSKAPYALTKDEKQTLAVSLPTPSSTQQSDLVDYVVAIDDAKQTDLKVRRSLLHVIAPYAVDVRGPSKVRAHRPATYRLTAQDPITRAPLAQQPLSVTITQDGEVTTRSVTTSETGDAVIEYESEHAGNAELTATIESGGTHVDVSGDVVVEDAGQKLLLTSDKPIYQPGQTMHLRALGLERGDNLPLADTNLTFEVRDGKGNKVLKKDAVTDRFGVAAADFRIGNLVNEGTYTLSIATDGAQVQKTVSVSHYALPKFEVAIATDKPFYRPSETVSGTIDARYFFGKLLGGGDVVVEGLTLDVGETVFSRVMGKLDERGHYAFSLTLPASLAGLGVQNGNALAEIRVTVTDTAGQAVSKTSAFPVSATGVQVSLVPEATSIVPGVENQLLLFATDPLGNPLDGAQVTVTTPDKDTLEETTDSFGQAMLAWTPPASATSPVFQVALTAPNGEQATQTFSFATQGGKEHLVVRTDKSVYAIGEEAKVEVLGTASSGHVYVDWLSEGQTVDMRTLTTEGGSAHFSMPIDSTLAGDNRIEAYVVDEDGNIVRAGRTIFARNSSALSVDLEPDRDSYAPGDNMKLKLSVRDENGDPQVAALGVQIVDRAVYSLVDAQPGLLRTYFELDDAFAKPSYEIQGPAADLSRVLFLDSAAEDPRVQQAAQQTSQATFAALRDGAVMGLQSSSYSKVLNQLPGHLSGALQQLGQDLASSLAARVNAEAASLQEDGCSPGSYCSNEDAYFDDVLRERVAKNLSASDFWGQPLALTSLSVWNRSATLTSRGPDELDGHGDDQAFTVQLSGLSVANFPPVPSVFEGGTATGGASAAGPGNMGTGTGTVQDGSHASGGASSSSGDGEPRVRRDFPETLYVNPTVITDENGQATLDVPLADSITEWRVSTLASSTNGKLGGGEHGVKVFQDFFVDVDFPASLTRGDEVTFPIAVYNYLDTSQTVNLELEPASFYTPRGATTLELTLEPGQVAGASFPVRLEQVGMNTLTVKAVGGSRSDAVARVARVVPDGKAFAEAHSGALEPGSMSQKLSFPTDSVPGSQQLYVDIYPGFLAQVVSGMDSMLQVPNGCFEQTTSTAWPNVLVTDYLRQTHQLTPEIELKADSLMSAGYQRLLTFEHPGGGFSWFGTQDMHPFVSVTAFGLMEFADMARTQDIDPDLLTRTAQWLAAQQQSDGSWVGDMSEFFSFQTSTLRNTAFVAWALASAGYDGQEVARGFDYVKRNWTPKADAYTLGIVANAFASAAPADPLLADVFDALDALKEVDGDRIHWDASGTQTTFYGSGNDADVTATALVAQALLTSGSMSDLTNGAINYLISAKDANGNFGSTQATIWSLRALTLAAHNGSKGAVGRLDVLVDGEPFKTLALDQDQSDVTTRVDLSSLASSANDHEVSLAFDGSGRLSYNIVARYNRPWANVPAESGPLGISVTYDKHTLYVNDTVATTVSVENRTSSTQNMVLVTLGIPPGFEVVPDKLLQSQRAGTLSQFETTGRQLILYVPVIAANATLRFEYDLRATMPVEAVDGGAEASLYYEPTTRVSAQAQALSVQEIAR